MKKDFHKLKPVVVEWIDSNSTGGWMSSYEAADLRCQTAGFLMKRDKKSVVICQNISAGGQRGEFMEIPAVAIRRVRRLK